MFQIHGKNERKHDLHEWLPREIYKVNEIKNEMF